MCWDARGSRVKVGGGRLELAFVFGAVITGAFNGRYSMHKYIIEASESLLDQTHANVQLTEIDGRSRARICSSVFGEHWTSR